MPNYVDKAIWDDPKKLEAREHTIVEIYREHFGESLPPDKQYWTMCGAHFNGNNKLDGELMHAVNAGVIEPRQFRGVDKEASIIRKNAEVYPETTWINDDFYWAMASAADRGEFNPAIVNYDGVMMKRGGARYLNKLIMLIDDETGAKVPMLLLANFMLNNPHGGDAMDDSNAVFEEIQRNCPRLHEWSVLRWCYPYSGSGKRSHTKMCTFVFMKNPRS